jgi:polysaccharide biosynthesis protein PslH
MKILWISHILPYPPKGGVVQRSYNLIKEISKKHEIYLLAFNHEQRSDFEDSIDNLRQICKEVEIINLPINNFRKYRLAITSFFSLNPYTARWLRNNKFKSLIRESIKKFAIEVLHFDSIDIAEYIKGVGELPKILNHHNIESQMMFRRFLKEKNLFKKIYFFWEAIKLKIYEKKMCLKFDYNLTVSDLDKERLKKICPGIKIEVISNGVDIDYFKPQNNNVEVGTLIFAGGMSWYPNRDAMLFFCKNIWLILKKYWPEVKVNIIGSNPPNFILKLSQQDPNLIAHGFVEDVRPYLEKAHVYVCPIRDGGGTKVKILDALAMGKPVVAHPVAVEGIDLEPEKQVLLASTPQEFAQQIIRLFRDKNLCDLLSKNGRNLVVEKYGFKKIGDKLSKVYLSLMN